MNVCLGSFHILRALNLASHCFVPYQYLTFGCHYQACKISDGSREAAPLRSVPASSPQLQANSLIFLRTPYASVNKFVIAKMLPPNLSTALKEIASGEDKDKVQAYSHLLDQLKSLPATQIDSNDWNSILDGIFNDSLGVAGTRTVLTSFIQALSTWPSNETKIESGQHVLTLMQTQTSSFEEHNMSLRELMADAYEGEEDHLAAANILAGIPLESSQRKVSPEDKARIWIRITRNYLEVDDTTSAETYLNKFKNVIYQIDDQEMLIHFQLSQARVQDARRDFLAASKGYQNISMAAGSIPDEERLHTLSMAIKCAVLAPAGPARSRALKNLYRDERSSTLEEFGILEKVFFDRLIAPAEVEKFAEGLMPHQLARTGDGSTVLAKAMGEHNLLGASRLYSNIGFDQLGALLGVDGEKAEETTARMIEQGRLVGRIDQIDQIIYFEGGEATGEHGTGRTEGVVGREMRRWDANVQGLAEEVEQITGMLQMRYPVSFRFKVIRSKLTTPLGLCRSKPCDLRITFLSI